MENRALAKRYAKALRAMDDSGALEPSITLLHDSLEASQTLLDVFQDSMVPGQLKLTAVRKAFPDMSTQLSEFLDFLQSKNRVDQLPAVLDLYLELRDRERGLVKGEIYSATPLSSEQVRVLEGAVGKKLGKHCSLAFFLDSQLIGGFSIQVEDTVYDCSVRSQLDGIRARFLNLAG
ncbi:MAG TPA: ATP synthase F1 subunit delta [Fibrobacteraceae bacterium]|nr:ATP synthase F1 subunit delta [Fibrobacteraceae bacterium]